LAQLFLGNAHGIRHLTAEFVDHTDELLGHGRGAMKHNGESGQALHDLVQDIKAQGRRNQLALLVAGALGGSELVSAVAGADGDSQGVAAGLLHELLDLLG
ncbi:Large polyvalent protein-associated domain-containing protein, partial [Dysosmobacter welbionis]